MLTSCHCPENADGPSCLCVPSSHSPHCREERSSSSEGQIRFLVYTLELASQRADSLGEKLTLALSHMQREERALHCYQ